jgi:pullulanase/glycogen debranching enzyme
VSEAAARRDGPRWPGRPYPLGATFDGFGTNFAVYSGVAERVELCLFEEGEEQREWGPATMPRSFRVGG